MTFPVDQETMNKNAKQMFDSSLFYAKKFGAGRWSFLGPGSDRTRDAAKKTPDVLSSTASESRGKAEAESELSLKSRSFLHKVNDQKRKRQYQSSKDATKDSGKHFVMWGMFMSSHWKHLYSWERITQTIGIPSKIQKISQ